MSTNFLQVTDNASTSVPVGQLNNTTSPIVITAIDTRKFDPVTTGYMVTVWDSQTYPECGDDPNMEQALVTAATIAQSGSLTLTRLAPKLHHGRPTLAILVIAKHLKDLATAVNTAESDIAARASLASPTFTGIPAAPTASPATNTTQVATTAFVQGEILTNATPDATAIAKGKLQLSGDLGGTATSPKTKRSTSFTVAPFGSSLIADYVCASSTGNETEINLAIAAANSLANGGVVYLKAGTYTMSSTITPKSNVTVIGEGPSTILKILANSYVIVNNGNTLDSFGIDNLTFIGNNTAGQAMGSMFLDGNQDPHAVSAPAISNITMRNCIVKNTTSLPVRIFGVTGKTMVTGCEFNHCLDAGFIFDDEVIFIGNHSIDSGDNGFSISRGCKKVTCIGNTSENATLFGMWFGGFNGDAGPTNLAISGNTVKNCHRSGIYLGGSPQNVSCTGNMIDCNSNRLLNSDIDGIQIYGDNTTTQFANNITVSGNTILNAARSGISLNNAKNVSITGNMIVNAGTQYLADGTTVIASNDQTTNIGIFSSHLTNTNVWIDGNFIIDNRTTPYCNYDIWKIQSTSSGFTMGTNYSVGMRTDRNRLDLINIPVEAGNDIAFNFNGPDTDISANINMQGAGQLRLRGTGSHFNIENTSTSSSAITSMFLSAGGLTSTSYTGGVTAKRLDASSSSIIVLRPMTNGGLMAGDATGALYYQGLPSNSLGYFGWNGGMRASRRTVADTSYTVLALDYIVAYTSLTAGHTVTLPTAISVTGQTYIIKDETGTAGTNNLTIATTLSQTIDGATTKVININYGWIAVYSDGANWKIQGGIYNASQFPTFNQNTTGSAATLTTPRAIYGNNFDGSAALAQIIASTYGGTGNGFTKFSGPTTSEKTYTLPNASATILTDNAAVTVGQGGTGTATAFTAGSMVFAGTSGIYTQNNSSLFWDNVNNYLGLLTAAPTHTLTQGSTSTGFTAYNTVDQTTNYERVRQYWSGNMFIISPENGGTGTLRNVQVGNGSQTTWVPSGSTQRILHAAGSIASAATIGHNFTATFTGSSLIAVGLAVSPTISQSSGAGYTALKVNPTESAVGSGTKLLADFQVGGTSKASIDNLGGLSLSSNVTLADATNIIAGTTTGTQIGTSASQKLGFFAATPIVQPAAATDLGTVLSNLGLRVAGATFGLTTSGTIVASGAISMTGSQRAIAQARTGIVTLTASSATNNECDATTGAFTITLPTVTGNPGVIFEFIKTDSSANAVTVGTTSSQTINGSTTYALGSQYKYVKVRANAAGTAWLVVGNN